MKVGLRNLGVAHDTIFEDEHEHDYSEDEDEDEEDDDVESDLSSPSSPLQSGVDAWYVRSFIL